MEAFLSVLFRTLLGQECQPSLLSFLPQTMGDTDRTIHKLPSIIINELNSLGTIGEQTCEIRRVNLLNMSEQIATLNFPSTSYADKR